ncbi:MAG TPA: spore germination protein [Symbiobacteriaceae bacterium]|jgi:hypothetical protein|nr:spore germination protein [Symbiobacteriaceae bacterium]
MEQDLLTNRNRLAKLLHWPENIGIEMRDITIGGDPGLLVWVHGLVRLELLDMTILPALASGSASGALPFAEITERLVAHRPRITADLPDAVNAIFAGNLLVLMDGVAEALLIDAADFPNHHAQQRSPDPSDDIFGRDARFNLALLRKRLRDPALIAREVKLKRPRAGLVALVHMEGRADRRVLRAVRRWLYEHGGEESVQRGIPPGAGAVFGAVPCFDSIIWPDKVAGLLSTGYVAVIVDRVVAAFVAPVTAGMAMVAPNDLGLHYPLRRFLVRFRIALHFLVLMLPGVVVALMNYHQEMIPTSFLIAVASVRENAPFGVFFEVALAEVVVEMIREATFRLEVHLPIGAASIVVVLVFILVVFAGYLGPLPAIAAALGSIASLALPDYAGAYMVRIWRYYLLIAAMLFGFFGMAAVLKLFLVLLCQSRTWGVPFLGPAGLHLTSVETMSSNRSNRLGGSGRGRKRSVVR